MIDNVLFNAYKTGSFHENNMEFRESIFNLNSILVEPNDIKPLKHLYFTLKEKISIGTILKKQPL
ncbi:hypothetical protein [Priestia megaterium]|uniref:hypothetical protein n=1 Tax=Priestia megaterium TaxID=1404 RepID=UPI00112E3321|nr:hypothetical protein [Priestia megaterium]TPF19095.1 hypothetical protein CBE78_07705 [Priestia megaterium]TPF23204.1 hypothetical protein CBE79_10215 [Priestia megaterium]